MCVRDVITLFTVVAFSQDSHGILELSNIAVGIRGAAKFVCPVRNYQLVIWREYVSHAMGTVIVHGSKIVKSKRMKRYQTPTTPYSHELYIPTAMPEDAGLYSCQSETNTTEYFGQLLLFNKTMNCSSTNYHRDVEASQQVVYSCTAYYFGEWTPIMQWTGPSGAVGNSTTIANRTSLLNGYVTSVARVTANPDLDGRHHVCNVRWQAPANLPPYHATNTPSLNLTFTTRGMTVLYRPLNITVRPLKAIYSIGDRIVVFANGNPPPQYMWLNPLTGQTLAAGGVFSVAKYHPSRVLVVAWNIISKHVYNVKLILNTRATTITTTKRMATTTTSTTTTSTTTTTTTTTSTTLTTTTPRPTTSSPTPALQPPATQQPKPKQDRLSVKQGETEEDDFTVPLIILCCCGFITVTALLVLIYERDKQLMEEEYAEERMSLLHEKQEEEEDEEEEEEEIQEEERGDNRSPVPYSSTAKLN